MSMVFIIVAIDTQACKSMITNELGIFRLGILYRRVYHRFFISIMLSFLLFS